VEGSEPCVDLLTPSPSVKAPKPMNPVAVAPLASSSSAAFALLDGYFMHKHNNEKSSGEVVMTF